MKEEKENPEQEKTKSGVSRRQFIAGTVGSAAVLGAMTSLIPGVSAAVPLGEHALAGQAAGAPAASTTLPSSWDLTADVVVVGSGIAGLGAAIEAYDNGASVIIIEKETKFFGGNSMFAGGNQQMPANFVQVAAGIEDHPEWAVEDYMVGGDYRSNRDLLTMFAYNANDTALWEQNFGIVWNKTPSLQSDCRVARTLAPVPSPNYPGNAGISEIYILNKALNARGVFVQLGRRMTTIYRPSLSGPVVGIQVQDLTGGSVLNYKANRAVILATGGNKCNHQLVRSWNPQLDENFIWSGYPYTHTTGDGHIAAVQVGAGYIDMSWPISFSNKWGTSVYSVWTPTQLVGDPTKIPPIVSSGLSYPSGSQWPIMVAADGGRFMNEAIWGTFGETAMFYPDMLAYLSIPLRPRNVWAIVDATGAKALNWSLANFQAATEPTVAPYLDSAYVAWSNTISGLADQMHMSATNLNATIARWNGFVAAGKDSDFGRTGTLNAISTPPYQAAKFLMGGHDQCGGIRINTKAQVIDCQSYQVSQGSGPSAPLDSEAVIPHLYAAGELAGGFWGDARHSGKMGSYCVVGRMAGRNAAAETPLT
jgi:urocanate reductase